MGTPNSHFDTHWVYLWYLSNYADYPDLAHLRQEIYVVLSIVLRNARTCDDEGCGRRQVKLRWRDGVVGLWEGL